MAIIWSTVIPAFTQASASLQSAVTAGSAIHHPKTSDLRDGMIGRVTPVVEKNETINLHRIWNCAF
jgi:hypothetical protein